MKVLLNSFHLNGYTLRVLSTDLKVSTTLYSIINHHTKVLLIVSDINNFLSQVIEQNLKKLIFYYGATDHWAPVSYYEDMKKKFPEGEIYLCERKFKHAFVLESSEEVAEMVAPWIQDVIVQDWQQGL